MKPHDKEYTTIHYQSYLALDKILNAQHLRSAEVAKEPAHEEMLFIIVHQSYEIWFKQIIHELESVIDMFDRHDVDEKNIGISIARLNRVIVIFKLLVEHIPIMETMTPLDFLDFRKYLFPASGFQSFQFRKIENLLGLPEKERITYHGHHYAAFFSEEHKKELKKIASGNSLFEAVEEWLERTPFLQLGKFNFLESYQKAVESMIRKEEQAIQSSQYLDDKEKKARLKMVGNTETYFKSILQKEVHEQKMEEGKIRLSYKATVAALMISLYNEEPLLQLPYRFLLCLIDIDELLTTWRYRHAQMVQRMLGRKVGTGGSSGHEYLHATAVKHHIFTDLHNISTLLIPRSELPDLPKEVKKQLGFYYSSLEDW
jgi:tryptophan 2,3-dioxygenase